MTMHIQRTTFLVPWACSKGNIRYFRYFDVKMITKDKTDSEFSLVSFKLVKFYYILFNYLKMFE